MGEEGEEGMFRTVGFAQVSERFLKSEEDGTSQADFRCWEANDR